MNHNRLQETIAEIIYQIANVEGSFDFGDSVQYGLRNYIARHSLASDGYYVSELAFSRFREFGLSVPLTRSKLSDLKAHFTYEHPVPAKLVLEQIKNSNRSREEVSRILAFADCVTLVTKEEDRQISERHRSSMPDGWAYFNGSNFARYEYCNIAIRSEKIPVTGRLVR